MTRRKALQGIVSTSVTAGSASAFADRAGDAVVAGSIERWDFIELRLAGPSSGNPFLDVRVSATFRYKNRVLTVQGFYDGGGAYKVRFMPDEIGHWTWTTSSNATALDGKAGAFECAAPAAGNHGPVSVRDGVHFGYADGTPFVECGTTCYAWAFQSEPTQRQTIATLTASPFNKLRMCIFPKWYEFNRKEPPMYPFPWDGDTNDYSHFNPAYFQHFDALTLELRRIGVEADLILFHPYAKWGDQSMPADVNERYLRYVIARFSAFRNVWWSLANEYDFLKDKTDADWDSYARILTEYDAFGHLRSIHYGGHQYEYWRGWCSHAGLQDSRLQLAASWRRDWRKPVVFDECKYEGNIEDWWGNISGDDLTHRFWMAAVQGCYCGHGETLLNDTGLLWWAHGGTLYGSSPTRIAFLRSLLQETIAIGGGPIGFTNFHQDPLGARRANASVIFYYFEEHQLAEGKFELPNGKSYAAEYIDTLQMTRTSLPGEYSGTAKVKLPGKPWGSLWFREKGVG